MSRKPFIPDEPATPWVSVGRAAMVLAFLCLVGILAVKFVPQIREYRATDAEVRALEEQRAELQREKEQREAELVLLEKDPHYIEMKARDLLDLYRDGEVVFRFETDSATR